MCGGRDTRSVSRQMGVYVQPSCPCAPVGVCDLRLLVTLVVVAMLTVRGRAAREHSTVVAACVCKVSEVYQ